MLSGLPVIYGISPNAESATPLHQLGSIGMTSDGRKFRYVQFGVAPTVGNVMQAPAEDTGDEGLTAVAATAGDMSISLSAVTATVNQYADGYLIVTVTPGLGTMYRIKSHAAGTAAEVKFNLYEPVRVALTTTSRVDLVANPYKNIIQSLATSSALHVGVAVLANTISYYGWVQTGGVASVLADASAIEVGKIVVASDSVAGAATVLDSTSTTTSKCAILGEALTGVASGECGAVYLTLD